VFSLFTVTISILLAKLSSVSNLPFSLLTIWLKMVFIAFMVASTRFRRLFTTGGGYTLFMPALVKTYTETPNHPGIRVAIEYAISRFYALHEKSFLYQSINVIGQLSMFADLDVEWFSKGVFDLFASLRKGSTPSTADVAGIRNATKAEEREDLIIHTADEKPQTFLAAVRRTETKSGRQMLLHLPDEYETKSFTMDDFVRLFLTIIAHDLSITRAQHFLRLLRFITPHLYNASNSSRTVLADGIVALGAIMTKHFSKPKAGEVVPKMSAQEEDSAFLNMEKASEKVGSQNSRTPSDSKVIRLEYLQLVLAFGQTGGQVTLAVVRHAIDVLKSLLKDWGDTSTEILADFLHKLVRMLLDREEAPTPKAVVAFLRELAPILHTHTVVALNLTGVFESVLALAKIPNYANDHHFCEVVVTEICTAGLSACDLAASERQLMSLQYRPVLISLLAEAVFFKDVDVIGEIEKRAPTYQYLAGIVLPFVLVMRTESQIMVDGLRTDEHRKMLGTAWIRILFYAITACERSRKDDAILEDRGRGLTGSFRSKSDKSRQEAAFWRSHLPTLMMALEVIKVVIVRGSADISSMPRIAIWERLSVFFTSMFAEGNADFAFGPDSNSPLTTPTASPRTSSQFYLSTSNNLNVVNSIPSNLSGASSLHLEPSRGFSRPRIVDYCLWSMLELVCAYRSPLRMQLKILMMEKVVALDRELQKQAGGGLSPFPTSPSSRRVSASLFSKSRQRSSTSLAPSPDTSPRLVPSSFNLLPAPSLLEIPARRPGYQISPVTPHNPSGLPKIVHLGPTSPSVFSPAPSPMIGGGVAGASGVRASRVSADSSETPAGARLTKIRSLKLVHETYRRIRGVQLFMGYDLLLPLPNIVVPHALNLMNNDDATLATWSKQQALSAIVKEVKDLMDEFAEAFTLDDDSVMVEIEPRASYTSDSTL